MPETETDIGITADIGIAATIASIIFFVLGAFVIVIILLYRKRRNNHLIEKQHMQSTFQNTLLQTRLEIQEETFKTISQEIHDNIGQSLSFVKLNLNTIDGRIPPDIKEKLLESKDLLSKSIQDLRDIARSLNPDFISEIGLHAAIDQQLLLLEKTGLFKTSFVLNGVFYKNNNQHELVVFRIVQELLNNIVKHAEASEVNIRMHYKTEQLEITVQDNGKGFNTSAMQSTENNNGLGLRNMLNRMTLINGFITINSKPNEGTTAIIELPKAQAPGP